MIWIFIFVGIFLPLNISAQGNIGFYNITPISYRLVKTNISVHVVWRAGLFARQSEVEIKVNTAPLSNHIEAAVIQAASSDVQWLAKDNSPAQTVKDKNLRSLVGLSLTSASFAGNYFILTGAYKIYDASGKISSASSLRAAVEGVEESSGTEALADEAFILMAQQMAAVLITPDLSLEAFADGKLSLSFPEDVSFPYPKESLLRIKFQNGMSSVFEVLDAFDGSLTLFDNQNAVPSLKSRIINISPVYEDERQEKNIPRYKDAAQSDRRKKLFGI